MVKLLFGQSYFLRFDAKLWQAMQPYPPLGTLYAAGYARSLGHDVALFDAMLAESEADWQDSLNKHSPELAILFEDNFNYLSKMCLLRMRQAAFEMTKMAKGAGVELAVCGADATDHGEKYFGCGADFVLQGEGEETLGELLQVREDVEPNFGGIAGLSWKDDEKIINNPPRPVITDVDALPFPAWDLVDIPRYRKIWRERHGYYSMNMVTTRGCPYHCNWCAKPIWGQRYNVRSPENVVEEMMWLHRDFEPDHLWFADDIMGLKPGWFQEFASTLEKKKMRIPFKCLSRADLMLESDTIEAMRRAGAETVWMGAESGSQKILDAMEKGTTVEQIYAASDKLKQAGIRVAFFLQFGYPGETREDIEMTLEMVRDCRPDDIGISVSYPLPGTKFYERVKAELDEKQNWQDSADLAMLYRGPFTTDFYRQLHTMVHKEFRQRKFLSEWRSLLHQPQRLRPVHAKRLAAAAYYKLTLPLERSRLDRLELENKPNHATLGQ